MRQPSRPRFPRRPATDGAEILSQLSTAGILSVWRRYSPKKLGAETKHRLLSVRLLSFAFLLRRAARKFPGDKSRLCRIVSATAGVVLHEVYIGDRAVLILRVFQPNGAVANPLGRDIDVILDDFPRCRIRPNVVDGCGFLYIGD